MKTKKRKNTNLVTVTDDLPFWLGIIKNMELCARIKETSFLHFEGDQGYQKEPISEAREKPEDEHDGFKPYQFISRLINCYLWMISYELF